MSLFLAHHLSHQNFKMIHMEYPVRYYYYFFCQNQIGAASSFLKKSLKIFFILPLCLIFTISGLISSVSK